MSAATETPAVATPLATTEDRAILRTVAYAGIFQYPLRIDELQRSLMDVALDTRALEARLQLPPLADRLAVVDGFVVPRGREDWLGLRRERERHTERLLQAHRSALAALARLPFVRLVALSGACAHGNATDGDVDVFLVVAKDRAWSVTLTIMALAKIFGLRRTLCVNYVVDEEALVLPETDVFTGAEVVGMKPLAGREAYGRFVEANPWVGRRYPNFGARHEALGRSLARAGSPWIEALVQWGPAQAAEGFARRALGSYLRRKANGHAGVTLTPHVLKLHLQDHRPRLTAAFDRALADVGETP